MVRSVGVCFWDSKRPSLEWFGVEGYIGLVRRSERVNEGCQWVGRWTAAIGCQRYFGQVVRGSTVGGGRLVATRARCAVRGVDG